MGPNLVRGLVFDVSTIPLRARRSQGLWSHDLLPFSIPRRSLNEAVRGSAGKKALMQRIVPNLWFAGNAPEAAAFYTRAFPEASSFVSGRYPESDLPEFQKEFAGQPVTVDLDIGGYRIVLINAGGEFSPTAAMSFMVNIDPSMFDGGEDAARQQFDALWESLSDGAEIFMPVGEYPFSKRYGWVQDRFGVSWQLILTDPAGEPRPFLMPSLLFSGEVQNRAQEAIEFYTSLFDDARIGTVAAYPEPTGPAAAGALMFAEFQLEGQWFTGMDSGAPGTFIFTPGNSLQVECADQAEIDRLWEALSAVPEAEQCGWLVDRFGVSWQIVPTGMGALMKRPGAYERMLQMKKIVIADL